MKYLVCTSILGDPIADSYAYIARKNNSLMVIADGVNWGDKSMIAARCAVCASINYLNDAVFANFHAIYSTKVCTNTQYVHIIYSTKVCTNT